MQDNRNLINKPNQKKIYIWYQALLNVATPKIKEIRNSLTATIEILSEFSRSDFHMRFVTFMATLS